MRSTNKRRLPYRPGDWFAVPLPDGDFGLGLVARADGRGVVLGYFFGPRRRKPPEATDTQGLTAADAILIRMCGHLGLLEGEWQVIAQAEEWRPTEWPVPDFARVQEGQAQGWLVKYDDDTLEVVEERRMPAVSLRGLPRDVLSGSEALQVTLGQKLAA